MTHGGGSRLVYDYIKAPPRHWCIENSEHSKSAPLKQHSFWGKSRNLRFFGFFEGKIEKWGAFNEAYISKYFHVADGLFVLMENPPVACTLSIWFNLVKAPFELSSFVSIKSVFLDTKCYFSSFLWPKRWNRGAFTEEVLAWRYFLQNTFRASGGTQKAPHRI